MAITATATSTEAGTIRLAGDLAGSDDGLNPELTATGVAPGTYTFPSFTVDSKGRITSVVVSAIDQQWPKATSEMFGKVKPDGDTIKINPTTGAIYADLQKATPTSAGIVQPDGTTITVNSSGVISARLATATTPGIVKTDNTTVSVNNGIISATMPRATASVTGAVKPDNKTIGVNSSGVIFAKVATSSTLGAVKPDGTTIDINASGVISAMLNGPDIARINKANAFTAAQRVNPHVIISPRFTLSAVDAGGLPIFPVSMGTAISGAESNTYMLVGDNMVAGECMRVFFDEVHSNLLLGTIYNVVIDYADPVVSGENTFDVFGIRVKPTKRFTAMQFIAVGQKKVALLSQVDTD